MSTAIQDKPVKQEVPQAGNTPAAEIKRIFDLQQANKQNVKNTTVSQRKKKLKKLIDVILKNREAIRNALWQDFKKHPSETDFTEVYTTLTELRHARSHLSDWMRPQIKDTPITYVGTSAKSIFEPKGASLIIAPWNYPFQLAIAPLGSAVAAGCTAIVKPSEYTPNTSKLIKEVVAEVFDENEVAVVEGDYTASTELLKLKFDHIFFTGSPQVGKIVMRAAAEHLTSVTLELGGKSPVIVDETANIKKAAKSIAWGKLLNGGQTCIAPDYVLVHSSKHDGFIAAMKKQIKQYYGTTSEAIESCTDYCRMVNAKHHNHIKKLINDAVDKGANIEFGGDVNDADNYVSPTIISNVPLDADIMQIEVFGPVLPIIKYENLDDALAIINEKEKPLSLYIFSEKSANIDKVISHTSAGDSMINDTVIHFAHPELPFGGVNNSGIGKAHGHYGFKEFSHERAILNQWSPMPAIDNLRPPYKGLATKMIDLLIKYF